MHVSQPPEAIFDWMLHVSLGETFNGPLTKDFGKPPILATLWLCPWSIGKTCASLEPFHQGLYASAFTKLFGGILRVIMKADKPKPQPHQLQMEKDFVFGIDLLTHFCAFDTHCHTGP